MPKVSVCIPSYQLGHLIARTIDSVLAQTFTDWELLIEDDGSTDNSAQVLKFYESPRVSVVLKTANEGQNKTTNNLVRRATGDYIALLAADDVWEPEKLAKQVAYLDANPDCGIAFGLPRFIDEADAPVSDPVGQPKEVQNRIRADWQKLLKNGNLLYISTSLYRRELHAELGYFSEDLHLLADLEWYARIVKAHDLHVIQEPLASIRRRDDNANLSAITGDNLERHCDELDLINERLYPIDRSKKKIMISTPFYENKGYSPYIRSMFQTVYALARHTTLEFDFQDVSGGSYIDHNRNLMADMFLKSDCTHLFFLDSDQSWDFQGFLNVLKADVEIVGAAYPVKNNWENYGVTIHNDENNHAVVNEDGLIKAQKVPTGFMKISRTVFEKLKKANPHDWYWDNGRKLYNFFGHITLDHVRYGEDISFGIRWQAIGGDIWVEPRVNMGHFGVQGWYGNYDAFLKKQPGGSDDPARKTESIAA
jgi:glycosyltransferase involved in cell wall biosynthesis